MNSRERMQRAMTRRVPDRVPVMCQLSLGHYFLHAGLPPHRVWFTSEGFAEALVRLRHRYRFDGILVNIPGRPPDWARAVRAIDHDGEREIVRWKDGSRTILPPDDNPWHEPPPGDSSVRPRFEAFDPERDLDRLDEWSAYTWGVYHAPRKPGPPGLLRQCPPEFLRTLDLVLAETRGTVSVHGEVFSPFTHFLELFGYQEGLLALASDPGRAAATIEGLAEAAHCWARAQARRGVDAVLISSAFAGAGFLSRAMYRDFVLPSERRLVGALHEEFPSLPVYVHTCGRISDRLELLAESGADGIDTLDPPPLGDTELADAKQRIGSRMFIKGNINSVALLADDANSAERRARETLAAGKPGGGYILSTACAVAPRTDPRKLARLVDLAEEEGAYPSVGDLGAAPESSGNRAGGSRIG